MPNIFDVVAGGAAIICSDENREVVVSWNGSLTLNMYHVSHIDPTLGHVEVRTLETKPPNLEVAVQEARRFIEDVNVMNDQDFEDLMEDEMDEDDYDDEEVTRE